MESLGYRRLVFDPARGERVECPRSDGDALAAFVAAFRRDVQEGLVKCLLRVDDLGAFLQRKPLDQLGLLEQCIMDAYSHARMSLVCEDTDVYALQEGRAIVAALAVCVRATLDKHKDDADAARVVRAALDAHWRDYGEDLLSWAMFGPMGKE